ncbi:MAG: HEAT repeat domain-containing protein [Polyangiaceae bacterium]
MRRSLRGFGLWVGGVAAACAGVLFASAPEPGAAHAQPIATDPPPQLGTSLKTRFGIEAGRLMLSSRDPLERASGVERLGTSENPQSVDALIDSLDKLEKAEMLEARLMAVRVLRDHVDRAEVRDFLVKEMMTTTQSARSGTIGSILRASAALALARWGDDRCVDALFGALGARGPAAEAARAALLAYPPRSLDVVLFTPDTSAEDAEDAEEDLRDVLEKKPKSKSSSKPSKDEKPEEKEPKAGDAKATADPKGAGFPAPKGQKLRTLHANAIEFLGDLGDLRAVPVLRFIARGDSTNRPAAGLALAKFGDDTSFGDARRWAKSEDVKLAETGARILVLLDDWTEEQATEESKKPKAPVPKAKDKTPQIVVNGPPAVKAVARLLSTAATRRAGFQLILDARSPANFAPLVEALTGIAHEPTGDERSLAVIALARIAGPAKLAVWLDDAEMDHVAAFAIATTPGPDATDVLSKALAAASAPAKRRLVVRAGIVRAVSVGATVPGLEDAIASLEKSKDPADVDAAAFARVALGADVAALVGKPPTTPVTPESTALFAGAARAAVLRGDDALAAFIPFLKGADDGQDPSALHVAAGVALLTPDGRKAAPQQTLLAWTEGGGALAPLAALALPTHDDDAIRPRIKALLLEGTDPVIRAHLALGLADDPEPSSVSLLCEAYMSETSPVARRAIVRALASRTESQRTRILAWAADLDPDETNRSIARLALQGSSPKAADPLGLTLSWTFVATTGAEARPLPARFLRGDDYAVSVLTASDGDLLVPTTAYGTSSLTVYPTHVDTPEAPTPPSAPPSAEPAPAPPPEPKAPAK